METRYTFCLEGEMTHGLWTRSKLSALESAKAKAQNNPGKKVFLMETSGYFIVEPKPVKYVEL